MLDFLMEFSRTHCLSICAFLVPATLLANTQVVLFSALDCSAFQVRLMAAIASLYALVIVLHVFTWFVMGIIMLPTFVLLAIALSCWAVSGWIAARPHQLPKLIQELQRRFILSSQWVGD